MKKFLMLLATLLFSGFALAAVNINTATLQELDALPGIGPVKAQAIIDYRTANGPFKSVEDIMKVKGIKDGEFAKIKGEIAVSGTTKTPAAASTPTPAAPMKAEPAKVGAPAPAAPMKTEAAKAAAPAPVAPMKAEP